MILNDRLEQLLLSNWAQFLDKLQLMKIVLEHASNNEYPLIEQEEIPPRHTKIQITKFTPNERNFAVWVEFTVPKGNGVLVGTHTFSLTLNGELTLNETYGTHFVPKS